MRHKRVYWLLVGNEDTGSSRIHGFNIHKAFVKRNIKSRILKSGYQQLTKKEKIWILLTLSKGDLLILQKRKEKSLKRLLYFLKIKGVNIAFIDCDLPICDDSLVKYFDYIICPSKRLKELYKTNYPKKDVKYIPDAVEYFSETVPSHNKKAIYFGWLTEDRKNRINSLRTLFKIVNWDVVTMSNKEDADIPWYNWSDEERFNVIGQYCVSLIPVVDDEASSYKSANRVLQSLALGNIVLCGDIDSYREVITDGENGFICSTQDQWITALKEISNPDLRHKIIKNGYDTAKNYTIDKIILRWISFLQL
ncbi:glycosyltransferase [Aequorivita xiaoshiensis]|uniref:Glycosyltransferase n=1 Tax=Aequorivita xiaoshiensis TaxID=2874476 RepID=A0A9X1U5J6_9FLAO|nr:glycosyltransferase [Aequorivita xiaoshiensis]MCG2432090.1 glycosyltransferase [Aequorivita xiaoshiensis]